MEAGLKTIKQGTPISYASISWFRFYGYILSLLHITVSLAPR